ncbi:cation-translocating P-type ATPase [Cnuibacter physcomitrellae]|uniref:cation-translocating P-type ATPase n=1 Tax=Cnuibacter physcomitrellae TaxID=1619308 RepID=UPI002175CA03|nr:cation-translocating P-type ATPase [Cnuibacter physcomitrellae]MCS5495896.1 cation-translocating P-type ATPase [Cnuibacter physcomitrellae]
MGTVWQGDARDGAAAGGNAGPQAAYLEPDEAPGGAEPRPETPERDEPLDLAGLSAADVAERIAAGQTNAFVADSSRSVWSIVRANVFTLFNAIVAGCFLVLLLVGRWQDALFGFSAIANALIGSIQEYRAKLALDRLALLNAADARVRRDGIEVEVPTQDIVKGDLLVLRAGDQVPADSVVVFSNGLQLDESMLTGESDAIDKIPGTEVLSGSVVVAGEGYARADKLGADSFANRFADEAKRFSLVASELRTSINRVLRWVSWIIGPVALLVLNSQVIAAGGWERAFQDESWRQAVVGTIAALVAMIPLGLVLMTSIAFAVGAVKLARQKVLVQELPAVEGLARIDIICLDKTGTLTEGDIVFDDAHPIAVEDAPGWDAVLAWWGVQPDSNATAKCLAERFTAAPSGEPVGRTAFSSARKWSAVSFGSGSGAEGTWVLGGPEMVFPAGAVIPAPAGAGASGGGPGGVAGAVPAASVDLLESAAALAASGRRTLVLARSPHGAEGELDASEELPADLEPVSLLTFRESVRPDARETLAYFASQGVDVRVISGDNPQTVAAIAREVGLDAPHGFDARQLPDDEDELIDLLRDEVVFGRVTPEQKKRIVLALKAAGRTVAMTGDGVNDALAIKEADIGIAMNSGSPATKAVARLILLDGRFSHLPGVVAEGRQVIANIERVSMLFLTKTAYATGLAVVFGAMLMQFPFLPRQLSVIDGLTIGLPAFFLALLPNAQRYSPGFLRRSLSFAIPAGVVVTIALAFYSRTATSLGIPEEELRTGTTLVLTIIGLWILVVLSRPITLFKTFIVGAMMIGLILVYSIPIVGDFLQLTDPGSDTAVLVIVTTAASIGAIEVVRAIHRRFLRSLDAARRREERAARSRAR